MKRKVVSVVIPVMDERDRLPTLLAHLRQSADIHGDSLQIIVAISNRDTAEYTDLQSSFPYVLWLDQAGMSRAEQMNAGVQSASGDVLWFVHADVLPHMQSIGAIQQALQDYHRYGWFSYRFDKKDWRLSVNAWCTRFDGPHAGGGDQCIWVEKDLFLQIGQYQQIPIMEDFDLIRRLRQIAAPAVLRQSAIVSARKYQTNSYWKVNVTNARALWLWKKGCDLLQLKDWYRKQLNA